MYDLKLLVVIDSFYLVFDIIGRNVFDKLKLAVCVLLTV